MVHENDVMLGMSEANGVLEIPGPVVEVWQTVVDIMARILDVSAGLIMRVDGEEIEVLVSSDTEGNPYRAGDRERWVESGLYCERVVSTKSRLCVANAAKDPEWANKPNVKLNMISYLGFPILLPDGEVFGSICVMDTRECHHLPLYEQLMVTFLGVIERDLALIYKNARLDEADRELKRCAEEIDSLKGIIPICARCKQIRDDEGFWHQVDAYIEKHSGAECSHGMCPVCAEELYGDQEWYKRMKNEEQSSVGGCG